MTIALLVGAGAVGARAGRQLVDTPGLDELLVCDSSRERADQLASLLGRAARAVAPTDPLPEGIGVVASAVDGMDALVAARAAVDAGIPVAAVADEDDAVTALLGLGDAARRTGTTVVVGCALAPGLVEVLARHAAAALDSADEVHVARVGCAGPACIDATRRARKERTLEWHEGAWRSERRLGSQLVFFPEPVGARECESVATGVALLRDAIPDVRHATVRVGEPPTRGALAALKGRKPVEEGWGGVRVEVWGWRGDERASVVYGLVAEPAIATGTVLAVTAARLAGLLPDVHVDTEPGAFGLGTYAEPAAFLAELARRGVRAAAFEGLALD